MTGPLVLLALVAGFMWAVLGHSTEAERQRTRDSVCVRTDVRVRYPDGYRAPVCNPTGRAWRG